MLDFLYEDQYGGIVAGIDEAGRGPWAGPVVAASVILDKNQIIQGINDSKKLTRAKRELLFEQLVQHAKVGVGIASVDEIDTLNILGATRLAMQRSYNALPAKADIILVDGNQLPDIKGNLQAVIGGDALCISIAAASIIAKVTRDRIMKNLAKEFPYYGWEHNVGYGTRLHRESLAKSGITPHHRKTFAPIRKMLEPA